jgi:hypothetical protein
LKCLTRTVSIYCVVMWFEVPVVLCEQIHHLLHHL